ncbi:MAG: aminomethyl transferase family protein [Acidobacteria bacterium]|nr:aminomethyl transferase family protein [Acidobacteriota bacterium]
MPSEKFPALFRSPLRSQLERAGAKFVVAATADGGVESAATFGSAESEYWALKESSGLMDLSHRGRLLVSGPDAARFLHGMTSNEVKNLAVGQGNHAFFLNVHGHILSDARVFRFAEQKFLIDCDPQRVGMVRESLEKHIIADQVEVSDVRSALACLAIEGPTSRELLRQAIGFEPPNLQPLESLIVPGDVPEDGATGPASLGESLRIARARITSETGFWLWAAPERLAAIWEKAVAVGLPLGAIPVGMDAVEICRVEAGLPRCGAEIVEKTLVQETSQLRAVSSTKGCYIGQEIVERVRSRGNVHRQLMGLLFDGPQEVAAGSEVHILGDAGRVHAGTATSFTYSFGLRRTIALAMLDIGKVGGQAGDQAEAGKTVEVAGLAAETSALPFFFPTARY